MSTARMLSTDEILAITASSALLIYAFGGGWLSLFALGIGAACYISPKPIGRWLGFSAFGIVLALCMLSFVYQVGADMANRDNSRDASVHG